MLEIELHATYCMQRVQHTMQVSGLQPLTVPNYCDMTSQRANTTAHSRHFSNFPRGFFSHKHKRQQFQQSIRLKAHVHAVVFIA